MNSSFYAIKQCQNCGYYEGDPRLCKTCGEELCELCECSCDAETKIFRTDYDYYLTSKIHIKFIYYVTDTFDIHKLVIPYFGSWFLLNDDFILKEIMNCNLSRFEEKDGLEAIIENVHKLPVIEPGAI